jgi:benzoylformate decarboxylase
MAEGYTRISGKVGVVNLHTMAGLAAATPVLLNAHLGGVPMLVTAGQQDTRLHMQEPHLTGDLAGLASYFTKWSTEITHAADIPMSIRRAFKVATQPPTGPVFVSLPQDIMVDNIDFEYASSANTFNGLRPDLGAVATAADLLAGAKSPAIVVEDGVNRNDAVAETVALAEMTGAPVYQAWTADVNFPNNHPQYKGGFNPAGARQIMETIDVLVVIGAPLFAMPMYNPETPLTSKTRIIQIDDNPWEISKNYPVAAGLCGHIKISLTELNNALNSGMTASAKELAKARAAKLAGEKVAADKAFLEKAQKEKDNLPIAVSRLGKELAAVLEPGTIVIDEGCSSSAVLGRCIDFTEPSCYKGSRGGASIGWGMPATLGAKLAVRDRPVVGIVGDGTAIWSIQSLWTAAHYNIPVTYIVCANTVYATLKGAKKFRLGPEAQHKKMGLEFNNPRIDYCQMAQAMGVPGQKAERPEELEGMLKSALASGKPNLVEVYIADES